MTLPVRRLDQWTIRIQESLSRLLSYLTDDSWSFDFVQRETEIRAAEAQRFLFLLKVAPRRAWLFIVGGWILLLGPLNSVRVSGLQLRFRLWSDEPTTAVRSTRATQTAQVADFSAHLSHSNSVWSALGGD